MPSVKNKPSMKRHKNTKTQKHINVVKVYKNVEAHPSLLIKLMDILHSPVEVGAGDDGSEDKKD